MSNYEEYMMDAEIAKAKRELTADFGGFALQLLHAGVTVAWGAYVFTWLWLWFVVEFFKLQPMPLAIAAGLMLMVRWLVRRVAPLKFVRPGDEERVVLVQTKRMSMGEDLLITLGGPAVVLVLGYFIHLFV